jgi:hypothetical protein
MVFFFLTSQGYICYMGLDKFENEELIKYGLPEDIWFHVDDMSSAHVYLRLNKNERLEDVSEGVIAECCQLVKANSIEGCKLKEVYVIFTRWRNLLKTSQMEVGAVSFHDRSKVKRIKVEKDNSIVKQLNKTKEERFPNLADLQLERAREYQNEQKEVRRLQFNEEKRLKKQMEQEKAMKAYENVVDMETMQSNKDFTATVDHTAALE